MQHFLLLAGCASHPAHIVPAIQAQTFDAAAIRALLQPCPIAEPKRYTAADTVRVANARRDALIKCNKDKAAALSELEQP